MAIGDDFTIDYTNKRIYHSSGSTVYTVNELYSYLQDTFDELVQMDDEVPMSAQTPTAYRMINGWWLDISELSQAHKYLKEGAIETSGYAHPTNPNGIRLLKLDGTSGLTANDIGKTVEGVTTGDTGTLLGYDTTLNYLWVRCDAADDLFDNTSEDINVDSVLCGAMNGVASTSGEELYANVYTLGTIESTPAPQIYIFQAGSAIAEWSTLSNWDRGHIDVLIQVKEMGTEIDGAQITVFARQQGDLFDHFEIDLSNGGRNAVPLSTQADINNTTPDYYIFYDNGNGTNFQPYEIIQDSSSYDWQAEVVTQDEWTSGVGVLGIRGVKGTPADGDSFIGSTSGATGDINASGTGVLGTGYIAYKNWSSDFATGEHIVGSTSSAKRRLIGIYEDVSDTSGYLLYDTSSGFTGANRSAFYKLFEADERLISTSGDAYASTAPTEAVAGFDDITVAFVNGTCAYGTSSGTFIYGERVTWGSDEGIILYDDGSGVMTLGNCSTTAFTGSVVGDISGAERAVNGRTLTSEHTMNKAFTQQTAYPYDIIIECGSIYEAGRTLDQVYEYLKFITQEDSTFSMHTVVSGVITPLDGEEYIQAYTGYTPKKQAPFGTFAGGVFFGAQGVWLEGMDSSDNENFSLIDSNGTVRNPPTQATMTVTSLVSGDRVAVFLTSGGEINKTQYNSMDSGNNAGNTTFVIEEAIAQDTPNSGKIRVVDDDYSAFKEHRYRYASWSGSTFNLVTGASGSASAQSSGDDLWDDSADFGGTDDVEVGDVIRNTTDGSFGYIYDIASATKLSAKLFNGTNNDFGANDSYYTNVLGTTYDDGDTAYVPLIDEEATGTSVEETVLYSTDRTVLIRVRKKGILPFETTGNFTSAGLTVSAIRTTDSIVS